MSNFPDKFGFIRDLRQCVGKSIEAVELMRMEFGCTWDNAFAVRFTDGTRAFFAGSPGTGIMNPQLSGDHHGNTLTVESSSIFTPSEYAEMSEARKREKDRQRQDRERDERRRYEELSAKYGKP